MVVHGWSPPITLHGNVREMEVLGVREGGGRFDADWLSLLCAMGYEEEEACLGRKDLAPRGWGQVERRVYMGGLRVWGNGKERLRVDRGRKLCYNIDTMKLPGPGHVADLD